MNGPACDPVQGAAVLPGAIAEKPGLNVLAAAGHVFATMTLIVRTLGIAIVAVSCTSPPCAEPTHLADCPNCAAGEIRHGVMFGYPALVVGPTPDAVVCANCDALYMLAADASVRARIDLKPQTGALADAGPDGAGGFYVATCPWSGAASNTAQLVAITADGTERWHVDRACSGKLIASSDGPYIMEPDPQSSNFVDVTAYAPDGTLRWAQPLSASDVSARVGGGLFGFSSLGGVSIVTFDATGATIATRVFGSLGYVQLEASSTDTGGLAVVGTFSGPTLDLGDMVLNATGTTGTAFVALLDAGTTRWAYTVDAQSAGFSTIQPIGDRIVVGGQYMDTSPFGLGPPSSMIGDGYLAVFGANGLEHAVQLEGPAEKQPTAFVGAPDGSIWVAIVTNDVYVYDSQQPLTGHWVGSSGLTIGSRSYVDAANNHHPVVYVVNLVP